MHISMGKNIGFVDNSGTVSKTTHPVLARMTNTMKYWMNSAARLDSGFSRRSLMYRRVGSFTFEGIDCMLAKCMTSYWPPPYSAGVCIGMGKEDISTSSADLLAPP